MKHERILNNLIWKTASHMIIDKNNCSNEMVFLSFFGIYQVRCQEIGNACSALMSVVKHAFDSTVIYIIRICLLREECIDKTIQMITVWYHESC